MRGDYVYCVYLAMYTVFVGSSTLVTDFAIDVHMYVCMNAEYVCTCQVHANT